MLTQKQSSGQKLKPELWGGIECTINRVNDLFRDQTAETGHYEREDDIRQFKLLGIRKMRYPILWEKHQSSEKTQPDWHETEYKLQQLKHHGIAPVAGLIHHGSGPSYTNLADPEFPEKFAAYAGKVAAKFPWIEYYTPVNEPLTTARFSGLYGFWYPHKKDSFTFLTILINELKATVLAMQEIRRHNPAAKLVQTEDLTKIQSTELLKYQAEFENQRRWLTYDLLCAKVNVANPMWSFCIAKGITTDQLNFFIEHPCPPDIIGCNYYLTSERFLDEDIDKYPERCHGNNGKHLYADIESVRVNKMLGLQTLLKEVWDRYKIPVAITEIHLNCSREEQMRWIMEAWNTCCILKNEGVNILALTAWALLGSYDWNSLITADNKSYESGVFDIRNNNVRKTVLGKIITSLAATGDYTHPILEGKGWWHNCNESAESVQQNFTGKKLVLITGKNGTLGQAFSRICKLRSVGHVLLSRQEMDICDEDSIANAINIFKPWAIINTAGFVKVDEAENFAGECMKVNALGAGLLAGACRKNGIKYMTFSSDMVFDGGKNTPYVEMDIVNPVNVYGASKVQGELRVLAEDPSSLIIRTSSFFGPWNKYNFAYDLLQKLDANQPVTALDNVFTSPAYVPDLVNTALDIFLDEEAGIWHITNDGNISWAAMAREIAERGGYSKQVIRNVKAAEMNASAKRPLYTVLNSEKGILLPTLDNALSRFFEDKFV